MLAEALNFAATYALSSRRRGGEINSSVRLWARARRCARDWAPHEENSRTFILDAMQDLRQRRTAVVLGSGLLRDVPIDALAASFDTIVLVDLVHLASVRLRLALKGRRNVRLIERDLSGYNQLAAGEEPEPLSFLRQVPYLDFVVSANLLSQIGLGVKRRLAAEPSGTMPEDALPRLIRAHIDGFAGLPCRTCLITDVSFSVIDRTGHLHETADLLHGVSAPAPKAHWQWPVAPLGEESRDYRIVHEVIAV
ncbi:hypothetical protein DFR48_103359 [Ciceribacter lividus]|uniref:Methyltransferase family protein n=1 Tax=Ciceribacter lividus TaxID=1197950 RepID=A0A6I7HSZ5_9HYPH|nr:hypothetical protein [Ciceribacter lividus]RCW27395.1 hypothetical protein DFR48_103359 [Ciceribacter lividus]